MVAGMESLCEMDCGSLKRLLKEDGGCKLLLLDCRSFLAFSAGHIRGAVNARANTIVRRRAKGSVSLEQILSGDDEARSRLLAGLYSAVILYDERTQDARAVKEDSTLTLVLNALGRDTFRTDVYLLKGGYDRFCSQYPDYCLKSRTLPVPSTVSSTSCGTPHHDQGGPVEILPFLFLGSALHASKKDMLDGMGISALLNVSSNCPNHFEGAYQYKCIPVEDNHKEDISSWFIEAIEFIDSIKDSNGRVLVHCQAGISRSATICLAYLMKKKRVRLEEAFEFVKQRRSIISPNFSFMGQLLQFESQVLATSCAVEAASPSATLGPKSSSSPNSPYIFSFPVSVVPHGQPSSLSYLQSPITTSPSC
ncbi:dual specificity protein phosphatase 4 [Astyanax mexicanus]|uniref:Dual specificity protein phosphatase n=2 Tax=Astyanax mexicanus TaxID=7994 RepID=A0A8B9GYS3_ASTMX|nr:dual specificity protein phosphatase 4 [Astyanax mexicanus]KAG9265526.1 dual specificity protein phosphatase 4 [Astyanax mexicanus]